MDSGAEEEIETLKKKHAALVTDIVTRVANALGTDAEGKEKAMDAVADLLEPAEEAPKKRAKKTARVEEEESD